MPGEPTCDYPFGSQRLAIQASATAQESHAAIRVRGLVLSALTGPNPDSCVGSLSFRASTRFLRFRPDKDAAECTWAQVKPERRRDDPTLAELLRR